MTETTMSKEINGVINPVTAPSLITITFNQCEIQLMKVNEGAAAPHLTTSKMDLDLLKHTYWVGTPRSLKTGLVCRHPLFLIPWGEEKYPRVEGSSALDFISWKGKVPMEDKKKTGVSRRQRPMRWVSQATRQEFVRSFICFCVLHTAGDTNQELRKSLSDKSGLTAIPGKMTKTQREDLASMGVKSDVINIARSNGLCFEYSVEAFMQRRVSPAYATVEKGEWDIESAGVAVTSNLFDCQVLLMEKHGLKFKRKFGAKQSAKNS